MAKNTHPCRVYTKVSKEEQSMLTLLCAEYGFKSLYQLLQTLVRIFLKYADTEAYEQEDESLGKEIEDMFDELMEGRDRR